MITVIIPTRNRLAFLREAVASVRSQSLAEWELVVVDDASDDGTWDWLLSLDDQRIRPIQMRQRGWQSAARNAGWRDAQSEFVLFLDHDDFLFPGALARLLAALRAKESAVAAVGARVDFEPERWRPIPHPRHVHFRDSWLDAMFGWVPQCGQALLRRSAVEEAGGWQDRYIPAEDHDFWVRFSRLGPVALIPDVVLGYRIHSQQTLKVFEAARNARTIRTIALRRSYLMKIEGPERLRGQRTVEAWRHSWIATRALGRARYRAATLHCWLAVRSAPWLLASPLSRPEIAGKTARAFVGLAFGDRAVRGLRHWKRAVAGVLRKRTARRESPQAAFEIQRPEAP